MFFNMNKGSILLLCISFIFCISFIISVTTADVPQNYQQLVTGLDIQIPQDNVLVVGQSYDFRFHVFDIATGYPAQQPTTCYFYLYNSTGDASYNSTQDYVMDVDNFNFTVPGDYFKQTGDYYYNINCVWQSESAQLGGFASSKVIVTTTGANDSTSFLLILGLTSLAMLAIAFVSKNEYFGFLSGLLFMVTGVYALIYGFNNISTTYTNAIGYVILGLGIILTLASAFQMANLGSRSEEEE